MTLNIAESVGVAQEFTLALEEVETQFVNGLNP